MAPRFAILGCLTVDSVITHDRRRYAGVAGGNVLYTALGASVWADSVGIVSRAGADYPTGTLTALAELGIDTSGVTRLDGPHEFTVAFQYTKEGHRSRTVDPEVLASLPAAERRYYYDSTSDETLRLAYAPDPSDIAGAWQRKARGWHLASLPRVKQRVLALELRRATPAGTALIADGVDAKDLGPTATLGDFDYVSSLDALLPSEADLTIPGLEEPLQRMSAFYGLGVPTVVMKFGPRGSVVKSPQGSWQVPPVPVDAADPTGAGDAFCGGFLVGYTETGDGVEAAIFGTVAASFAVEHSGPRLTTPVSRAVAHARADAVRQRVRTMGPDDTRIR